MHLYSAFAFLSLLMSAIAAQYVLEDDYAPTSFASMMEFYSGDDPTHGYVNYLSQSASESQGLYRSDDSSVTLGVDTTKVATGRGRDSVRVESLKRYNSGLFILDATHMPEGCGTWPAFWLYGPNWPNGGEIDIIEGVNLQSVNSYAAHTRSGCTVSKTDFTGALDTSNCDVNAPGQGTNVGCGIKSSDTQSYGSGFNSNRGGVYATEWTSTAISIWFFPRGNIPSDITGNNPSPANWGSPQAQFAAPCAIDKYFSNQRIVINTALCGDWAGGVWGQDATCSAAASTCQEFVQNNPSDFQSAYWSISSLRVYQRSGSDGPSTTVSTPLPSTLSTISTLSTTAVATMTSIPTGIPTLTFPTISNQTATVQMSIATSTRTEITTTPAATPSVTTSVSIPPTPSTFITSILTEPFPTSLYLPSLVYGTAGVPITEASTGAASSSWPAVPSSATPNDESWVNHGGHGGWNGGGRWGIPPGRRVRL